MSEDDEMDESVVQLFRARIGPGHRLGSKYVVGPRLGEGAMGVVHEATTNDGHPLAVKLLRPELADDPKTLGRFLQERRLFRRVQHPNVIAVHDLVVEGDDLAIVMERVSGGDLRRRLAEGPLPPTRAVRLAAEVAAGLAAIHRAGVAHRDLKPANILLTDDLTPKISDFGVARIVSDALSRTSTAIGTPRYMAPEAADHRGAGKPADVYALGAILFELLVGRAPFSTGGTFAIIRAHASDPAPRLAGVPPQLADLVDAMLAKEPSQRPTAEQVGQSLRALLPSITDEAEPAIVPTIDPNDPERTQPFPSSGDGLDQADGGEETAILPEDAVVGGSVGRPAPVEPEPVRSSPAPAAPVVQGEGKAEGRRRRLEVVVVVGLMLAAVAAGIYFLVGPNDGVEGSDDPAAPVALQSTTTDLVSTTTTVASTTTSAGPVPTTTTEVPASTSSTTDDVASTLPAGSARIQIVEGPNLNEVEARAFQFNYTTNEVCGSGNFVVREKQGNRVVGQFLGEEGCYGPTHGGYPGLETSEVFRVFELEPDTTYVVRIVVRGTDSDGTLATGVGRAATTFEVTTTSE